LRKEAKDKPCLIRVPGVCCGDPARVCLCHVRLSGVSGIGLKSSDLLAAFGCDACHKVVDGQVLSEWDYPTRRLMLLEGMVRTQAYLIEAEMVHW
jgi:hypothetical protein